MTEQTDVVIVGGGPTGALLSALLGKAGVPNIVLEKEADITTDPRGIALDEDGIRALQAIGAYGKVFTEIGSTMTRFNFLSGVHKDLSKRPLLSMDYSTSEGGTGHVGFICHKQPALERAIRDSMSDNSYSEMRSRCLVTGISEDSECVTVHYINAQGQATSIQSRFLVGADGKTGYVRKKYLEPQGITMNKCECTNYEETWVALNWKVTTPTPKTHPDFPLWQLGYTPTDVYDLFFPKEFNFLCNPERPAVCGRFGLQTDQLWRFEFVVHKGEDEVKMATLEETQKIIFPYLTHSGTRYGMRHDVHYPEDCIEVLRSRAFSFQARSCNRWAQGRVILVGDAAHVFPPFGGQGISSGFRDALGLAWRLAMLRQVPQGNHTDVIKAWYTERKQQLDRSLAATIQNGEYVTQSNPFTIFVRDWYLWLYQLVPRWRREIEKGARAQGMVRYNHEAGMPFLPGSCGGTLLPQVYAWDFQAGLVRFSDDLIFAPGKDGLLQVLILPASEKEAEELTLAIKDMPQNEFVKSDEAVALIQDCTMGSACSRKLMHCGIHIARIATAEEFAAEIDLCQGRPAPKYYDPYRISKEVRNMKFVLVRPDRYIYTACATSQELRNALNSLVDVLVQR
ncbi:hypothetical protein LTR64_002136 [Lithohypha guttulata]|uniref:uncharacterized protein n=1 Tax=Lithohypha guttulata TaxID=1690604 RepID=UPI002DDE2F3F|nr:hypothetical protein LTR51_007995 [Lithohypha guttulata]